METNLAIARICLNKFLETWTEQKLNNMKLEDYVSVGDHKTFCYAVERKTRILGSIHGSTSEKFGIYKRRVLEEKPKKYHNDDKYSWRMIARFDVSDRFKAFELVRKEILAVREAAINGKFEEIDRKIITTSMFKWKVAYLYSGERLISIFNRKVLERIGKHYGMNITPNTPISAIQRVMMTNKPEDHTIYQYSNYLYQKFSPDISYEDNDAIEEDEDNQNEQTRMPNRRATDKKNTNDQYRIGSLPYLAEQKHNKIQEALKTLLKEKYGENVYMEKDFVDLRVDLDNETQLYEIKSAPYASECVEQALGQILRYAFRNQRTSNAKLFIVGQYPANHSDNLYIDYVRSLINIELEYMHVDL